MVNWNKILPFSNKQGTIEAAHGRGYPTKEEARGQAVSGYQYDKNEIRLPHPDNMNNYDGWGKDPEARVALEVLTGLIAGVGYYTEMDEEYQPKKEGEKPHKNKQTVDKYGEDVNLDEKLQEITYRTLHKGFCAVERYDSNDSPYDLKLLPSQEIFKYVDKKGNLLRYSQEPSMGKIVAEWKTQAEQDDIIWFQFGPGHYGMSLLEPIGELLDSRTQMNIDMPKAIHRWAYPVPVMETSGDKASLQTACEDRDVDEWIFIGNAQDGDVRWKTLEINPQARFIPYIELIYYQIAEGLHAPLLLYLKNATEASANVMMESVDRLVAGRQRYNKRRIEKYLFKPQTGDPVPRVMWGQPKTGLEDVTFTELATIINSPKVAQNQAQYILKQYIGSIPEPDWEEEAKINKTKMGPMMQQQDENQPFKKKQEMPVEQVIERINDINMQLNIIESNQKAGKLSIVEACNLADRTITVHMKRAYPDDWQSKRDERFQSFIHERLVPKLGKVYQVSVPE